MIRVPARVALAAVCAACALGASPAAAAEPAVVPAVDLDRYQGTWHEWARFPHFFQRECVGGVTAEYSPAPDGSIAVLNRCRRADGSLIEARGRARVADPATRAKLEVSFLPAWLDWLPVGRGDYWIIALAPDYSTAVVGDRAREYLWILSRSPEIDEPRYLALVQRAAEQGYPVERLQSTPR